MKNAIKEYLEYSEEEKRVLWGKAVFVFDTNVLLNLYRYSEKTRDALLSAMTKLNERIWMPHQVAEEFMRRRMEIIYESEDRYKRLEESALSPFREKLRASDDVTVKPRHEQTRPVGSNNPAGQIKLSGNPARVRSHPRK